KRGPSPFHNACNGGGGGDNGVVPSLAFPEAAMIRVRPLPLVAGCLLGCPAVAHAGMPSPTVVLSDLARLRLQSISFFLAGFLVSALLIQLIWNHLRRDVAWLPRLSYLR